MRSAFGVMENTRAKQMQRETSIFREEPTFVVIKITSLGK